jgi:nitric oxide reductase activation protein
VRNLVHFGLEAEFEAHPPSSPAGMLFVQAAEGNPAGNTAVAALLSVADRSSSLFETAARLTPELVASIGDAFPGLGSRCIPPCSFLPDFLFPARIGNPPRDSLVADLKEAAEQRLSGMDEEEGEESASSATTLDQGQGDGEESDERPESRALTACFLYDEWSQPDHDYFRDYCHVHEVVPDQPVSVAVPEDVAQDARRVSRVFERFKPELARKEKYLQEGDAINPDLLLRFLVLRRAEPAPRVDFYERPVVNRRDLAVLILLDASGSTGEMAGERDRIIDVEKHAALILGQGLDTLGDRFAICGFNSNGREHCLFAVYKDFADPWDREAMGRALAATPANSTRIGPALRHAGYRLSRLDARQRLIILITDGRPMDSGYDPNTRYAQYDVRMACDENAHNGIHTFAISTEDNSIADMEIMFPRKRFAILSDIRQLPRVLPRLYTRLTV